MKQFLVVDKETLLPMGVYKSEKINLNAISSNHELVHFEIDGDFLMDDWEITLENNEVKLVKK
mgnify:CR=1 FL=1